MMRCLIVDDNSMARLAIRNFIEEVEFLNLTGECENALQAIGMLQEQKIDLLFLDVEMPHMNGLEMLESLTQKPLVILVTSKTDYAFEAFNLEVVDYLVKPVKLARFLKAVNRAWDYFIHTQKTDNSFIFVRVDQVLTRIDLNQILYIEAMGDYIRIVTPCRRYITHLTLKGIQERLPDNRFLRVHRSHLVALDKVDSFADNMVSIGDIVLPVSDGFRSMLLENMNAI